MIPKIIWQTHENEYNNLLPFQKDITNTWKNLNPGWEYRYVNAKERSDTVKKYSNLLHTYYLKVDKVRQSDIWRVVEIYNHGGFYADMDSICVETIEDSISKTYNGEEVICSLVGFQHTGVNNSNFGAIKNSKIIKSVIDSIILKYKKMPIQEVSKVGSVFLENYIFSNIALENKNFIFFNNNYYIHSKDFKENFNSDVNIIFNQKKTNYGLLCKTMNWPIYYI